MTLNHIKPHGALYGVAARDEQVAHAVCDAAEVFGVPLLGMAGTKHEEVYTKRGTRRSRPSTIPTSTTAMTARSSSLASTMRKTRRRRRGARYER